MFPDRHFRRSTTFLLTLLTLLLPVSSWSQTRATRTSAEQKTARYFESVRNQPSLLLEFLRRMPKGGDLHNHLSGAVYAESLLKYAVEDGLCIDEASLILVSSPCDATKDRPPASAAYQNPVLFGHMVDAFSMRQFVAGNESGHDHFFATFGKFGAATAGHTADMIAEARSRAATDHLQYMELMFNPDGGEAARLGSRLGWQDDLRALREQLLAGGLPEILARASQSLDEIDRKVEAELNCGKPEASPGCRVLARYLYQVARGLSREAVFAQILAGFEMASRDTRVVGLNLVMAEDWYVPIRDFKLHMKMLEYLHQAYPKVHITLHAGELTPQLTPPEQLFHIRDSVERGHAERIGHGVDIMQEPAPLELLRLMAKNKIMVEICLTSNDVILGVTGMRHPLPMYLRYGVPVALATDDPGVSRSGITQEYQRAVETYRLTYGQIKEMVRASISYSFLPGESVWLDGKEVRVAACRADGLMSASLSGPCERLLKSSEKAREQWSLERAFAEFEKAF